MTHQHEIILNKTLLVGGTIFGSIGISLHEVHEILSVVLQFTGLISFVMFSIINWEKFIQAFKKVIKKGGVK
jgi:hypothetical protein